MVKLNRITTGGGDHGESSLGDGSRLSKGDDIFAAIGDADEVNCQLGMLIRSLNDSKQNLSQQINDIRYIQHDLFDLGADLCFPFNKERKKSALRITQAHIERIEKLCDKYSENLGELTSFILPGGSECASLAHLVRATSRRLERHIVKAMSQHDINPLTQIYVNRLSDFLFQYARFLNDNGTQDILWQPAYSVKQD